METYEVPLVLDTIDQMKHDLYLMRIKENNTVKIATELRKFQSFYQIYILHNQNEKQKAMINVLEAQFEEENSLRKQIEAEFEQIRR